MKLQTLFLCGIVIAMLGCKSSPQEQVIIPAPLSVVYSNGALSLDAPIDLYTNLTGDHLANLKGWMSKTPIKLGEELAAPSDKSLQVVIATDTSEFPTFESYKLEVTPVGVKISAKHSAGLFYGIQSLSQLAEYHKDGIPAQVIVDSPRFPYRGFMLDVSRNFRDKEFVKKQLDMMAYYKLNRFHWHLTDGAGWRLEIKKYPILTEVAAWRPYATWTEWHKGGKKYCRFDDPAAQGGFFTQEDVKEVLAYADKLNITVIPEIELPGHSEEVLAVMPELSCSGKPYVNSDFCIGNEKTFAFLQDVLMEVMELFPSKYIHIGGDEASKDGWRGCAKCKKRMDSEKLANVDELQSYMIHRVEAFLNENGRALLGWDEILEGGLAPNATVMSWRGIEGGIAAAKAGHNAIMTPTSFCYLDYYQDDPSTQPVGMPAVVTIETSYSFDPAHDSLPADVRARILGVQGNLWTEHISTPEHVEYMVWPRLMAISEVAWSDPKNKDFADFRRRAVNGVAFMQSKGYAPFDLSKEVGTRKESLEQIDHLAKGKKVTYITNYHQKYKAAGDSTLTDGWRGNWSYSDKRWQGFLDTDMEVVIDLGASTKISAVWAEFMQSFYADIWMPEKVQVSVSEDGINYTMLSEELNDVPFDEPRSKYRTFKWEGESQARYIRYKAVSNQHPGGWIFVDEIFVK